MPTNYVFFHTPARENALLGAQVPFAGFHLGRRQGILLENDALQRALVALNATVETDEEAPGYNGVRMLRLRRRRNGAATMREVAIQTESWKRGGSSCVDEKVFTDITREFSPQIGVSTIVLVNNNCPSACAMPPRNHPDTFTIFFWSAVSGDIRQGYFGGGTATRLWEYRIAESRGHWNVWLPSGQGTVIKDGAGADIADLVGDNLYILYPINSKDMPEGPKIFRRILEEAIRLRGKTPAQRAQREKQRERRARAEARSRAAALREEARTNPVTVKCGLSLESLRESFVAVAKEFTTSFGGEKPILIYDYCHDPKSHPPVNDGRVHICIFSSPERIFGDGNLPQTVFGAPASDSGRGFSLLGVSGDTATTLIADEEGTRVGQIVGDTIYIHYPLALLKNSSSPLLCWDGKGPEALFRRILEEIVFIKTATEKEKVERARAYAEKHRAAAREAYIKTCGDRTRRIVENSKMIITSHQQKVSEYQKSIVTLLREAKEAERHIQQMESQNGERHTVYGREFDKLFEIPQIRDVRVREEAIQVFTDVLCCVDPRTGKRHEIGAFRIEMNPEGTVRWHNLTRKVDGYVSGMNAPHVHPGGKACLGNMAEVIPQLIADYEFAALAMVAIQFIQNVNVDDPAGKHINRWPLAKESAQEQEEGAR